METFNIPFEFKLSRNLQKLAYQEDLIIRSGSGTLVTTGIQDLIGMRSLATFISLLLCFISPPLRSVSLLNNNKSSEFSEIVESHNNDKDYFDLSKLIDELTRFPAGIHHQDIFVAGEKPDHIAPLAYLLRNPRVTSWTTVAIIEWPNLNSYNQSIFCTYFQDDHQETLIMIVSDETELFKVIELFCRVIKHCKINTKEAILRWPNVIFLFPNNNSTTFDQLIKLISTASEWTISTTCFTINAQAYLLRPNPKYRLNSSDLFEMFSVAEFYSIGDKVIVNDLSSASLSAEGSHQVRNWYQITAGMLHRRRNFGGASLRAVSQPAEEYFQSAFFEEVNGVLKFNGGFDVEYFQMLADMLNFSVVAVRGTGYIQKGENGQLRGMGQQLLQNEADISITHSEYLLYRQKCLSFLHPSFIGRVIAFFRQPPPTFGRDIYIQPLPIRVRRIILIGWALICFCFYVVNKLRQKYVKLTTDADFEDRKEKDHDYFLYTVASMCQQGWYREVSNFPTKVVLLTSLFFGLTLYNGFSAKVVSQLSTPHIVIQSFNDIINKSNMKIYVDEFTFQPMEYLEKLNTDGLLTQEVDKYLKLHLGFEAIENDSATYIAMQDEFYRAIDKNIPSGRVCKTVSEVDVSPILGLPMIAKAGMTMRKDFPFKDHLKNAQLKIQERGILFRHLSKHLYGAKPKCDFLKQRKTIVKLGLDDVFTPCVILICGNAVALIILIIESLRVYTCFFIPKSCESCLK